MNKDLGLVTAYAYALSKGYTGTEEEFAELMASYASVAEQAKESAEDSEAWAIGKRGGTDVGMTDETYHNNAKYYAEQAGTSAGNAASSAAAASTSESNSASSASSAAASASSAASSAATATEKAGEAATSATSASTSATSAAGSATNAAGSATAASASATAAGNAQTAAETAQGKAEDAQEAAEQAQSDAEAAAQSVSQSAAQIATNTQDIGNLKSAFATMQPPATASDVGKALIVKAVDQETGKPSSYEYGEAGGGGDTSNFAPVIIDSASGSIASFPDGANGLPVKKLVVNIKPVQEGSGDPGPTNVRPIIGWTQATVNQSGADTGNPDDTVYPFPSSAGTVYGGTLTINDDGTGELEVNKYLYTLTGNERFSTWNPNSGSKINSTALPYEASNGLHVQRCISDKLQGSDTGNIYLNPSENLIGVNGKFLCITSQVYDNLAEYAGAKIVYDLSLPITYQLTNQQVLDTLYGTNNIWADCGDVEVEYRADTGMVVAAKTEKNANEINATRAMLAPVEQGTTASQRYAVGDMLVFNGQLCKATAIIPAGDTLVVGTNIAATTVSNEFEDYGSKIAFLLSEIKAADPWYQGVDLTQKMASEISSDPWAWIQGRIRAEEFDGIHANDYIPFKTTNNVSLKACVAGINTYKSYGNPMVGNHIDFICRELWPTAHAMNKVNYNNGVPAFTPEGGTEIAEQRAPWLASDLYHYINSLAGYVPNEAKLNPAMVAVDYTADGIYARLPDALKAVIIEKRAFLPQRFSASGLLNNDNSWGWANAGKLWIPTEYEVYGTPVWGDHGYGAGGSAVQYPIFAGNMNRLKYTSGRFDWWLLSTFSGNPSHFCTVGSAGFANRSSATTANVAAPICFRVS